MQDKLISGKLGIYCRVSTDIQEKLDTISIQVEKANQFIKNNNITDFEFYKDDGISGAVDKQLVEESIKFHKTSGSSTETF